MITYENQVRNKYFDWLYDYVCKGRTHNKVSYKKLFRTLYRTEFTFDILNDENRAADGIDLRYRYSMIINDDNVMDILEGPCNVLEMLVALSIRCEENIMDDARYGNRTAQWFWSMLSNIGISTMIDDNFNREYVEYRLSIFLKRQYEPNGRGGLFYIRDCKDDLRNIPIWTQLCWYLDNYS